MVYLIYNIIDKILIYKLGFNLFICKIMLQLKNKKKKMYVSNMFNVINIFRLTTLMLNGL